MKETSNKASLETTLHKVIEEDNQPKTEPKQGILQE